MKRSLRMVAAVVVVSGALLLGAGAPAQAYCDPVVSQVTGQCDNACTVVADAFERVTGKTFPYPCAQ